MLKAEVCVVGTVQQAVQIRQNSQGGYYHSVSIRTNVEQKEGGVKEVVVSVSANYGSSVGLEKLVTVGQRVSIAGTMFFRKDKDNLYLNVSAKSVTFVEDVIPDGIAGEMTMIGVLGSKAPEVKNGKSGKQFMTFSAYSGDGEGENRTYTWVRFIRFSGTVESFLLPKSLIEAKGKLELQFFKGALSLSCRLSEVKPYVKQAPSNAPF